MPILSLLSFSLLPIYHAQAAPVLRSPQNPVVSWISPTTGDIYHPSETLHAVWTVPSSAAIIAAAFSFCAAPDEADDSNGAQTGVCGPAVWPEIDDSAAPTYSISMTIPEDVSTVRSYVVSMKDDLGEEYVSPKFNLAPIRPEGDATPVPDPVASLPSSVSATFAAVPSMSTTVPASSSSTTAAAVYTPSTTPFTPLPSLAPPPPAAPSVPPASSPVPILPSPPIPFPSYIPPVIPQTGYSSFSPSPESLSAQPTSRALTIGLAVPLGVLAFALLMAILWLCERRRQRSSPVRTQSLIHRDRGRDTGQEYKEGDYEKALQLVTQASVRVALESLHEPAPTTNRYSFMCPSTPVPPSEPFPAAHNTPYMTDAHQSCTTPVPSAPASSPYLTLSRSQPYRYPASLRPQIPPTPLLRDSDHPSLTVVGAYSTPEPRPPPAFRRVPGRYSSGEYQDAYDAVARVLNTPRV